MTQNDSTSRTVAKYLVLGVLVFGSCGFSSILFDLDHIWDLLGVPPPLDLTINQGRPFHTLVVVVLVSVFLSIVAVALTRRWLAKTRGVIMDGRVTINSQNINRYNYYCINRSHYLVNYISDIIQKTKG